jgi:hypothetical protein
MDDVRLKEFVQIAVFQVLYHRNVYSRKVFDEVTRYGVPVFIPKVASLKDYVESALNELGDIERLIVAILDERDMVLERFVFVISPSKFPQDDDEIFEGFRNALYKLKLCQVTLSSKTSKLRFRLFAETDHIPNLPWIDADDPQKWKIPSATVFPASLVTTSSNRMSFWFEERNS